MKKTNPIWLLTLLVMLPQFIETIYSPVLPMVQEKFGVKEESVTLTISLYFIAFALEWHFGAFNVTESEEKNH